MFSGCSSICTVSPVQSLSSSRSSTSNTINLQWVDLSDCGRLMDAGLHLMAKNSPHLRHLYLRRCINITGKIYDGVFSHSLGNAIPSLRRYLLCLYRFFVHVKKAKRMKKHREAQPGYPLILAFQNKLLMNGVGVLFLMLLWPTFFS